MSMVVAAFRWYGSGTIFDRACRKHKLNAKVVTSHNGYHYLCLTGCYTSLQQARKEIAQVRHALDFRNGVAGVAYVQLDRDGPFFSEQEFADQVEFLINARR